MSEAYNYFSYFDGIGGEVHMKVPANELPLYDILNEFQAFLLAQHYVIPVGKQLGFVDAN